MCLQRWSNANSEERKSLSHDGMTRNDCARCLRCPDKRSFSFPSECLTKPLQSLGYMCWPTEEIIIVPVNTFVVWDTHTHLHLHTWLISLISLNGSAVTPSCLGQTWSGLPAFRSLGMVAVWLCLDWPLTSLLRTTTRHYQLLLLCLSFSLSLRPLPPISSRPVTLT